MMRSTIKTGQDFLKILDITKDDNFWQIKRSSDRNKDMKPQGILFSGKVTNGCIGKCIAKEYNLIITIEPFNPADYEQSLIEGIEVIYKYDLFIGSLGTFWIYGSDLGKKLLVDVLEILDICNFSEYFQNFTYFDLTTDTPIKTILNRFNSIITFSPKNNESVGNLVFLHGNPNKNGEKLFQLKSEIIITFHITPSLLDLSRKINSTLVWLDINEFYNQITGELYFIFTKQFSNEFDYFSLNLARLNGLDGI